MLTGSDITGIFNTYQLIVMQSPASTTLTLRWVTGNSGVYDDDYKKYIPDDPTWNTTPPTVQGWHRDLTKEVAEQLGLGEFKAGDKMFWLPYDCEYILSKNRLRIVHLGITWIPELESISTLAQNRPLTIRNNMLSIPIRCSPEN
jgi:hypothetical protein